MEAERAGVEMEVEAAFVPLAVWLTVLKGHLVYCFIS